jgi:hypothetical protein
MQKGRVTIGAEVEVVSSPMDDAITTSSTSIGSSPSSDSMSSPLTPSSVRPSLFRKHSSRRLSATDSVMSVDGSGLHVNHIDGHQQHRDGSGGSTHTYEAEEGEAFAIFINDTLGAEESLRHLLPLDPKSRDVFDKQADGLILLKLLEHAIPNKLEGKRISYGTNLSIFRRNENLNLFLRLATEEGCHLVNIGAGDVANGK